MDSELLQQGATKLNGDEYTLSHGDYTATFVARGAALRQLQHRGRDLVVPFAADAPIPDYRGIIAAPWPNRIADGRYAWDGATHQLPLNEPDRQTALHGLVFDRLWTSQKYDGASLTLRCVIEPQPGYPASLVLDATYWLEADGLHSTVTATNTGENAAPYGVCPHPYLVAGPAPLDQWTLSVPAEQFLEVTPERLLPMGLVAVDGHEFDFRAPRIIGSTFIDHAFTGFSAQTDGEFQLLATDPSGSFVGMGWDEGCPWLQIHTADKPAGVPGRLGLAVEPMTCPPDAFNSGIDLISIAPGSSHSVGWRIFGG